MRTRNARRVNGGAVGSAAVTEQPPINGKADGKLAGAKKIPIWEFLQDEERDRDGTGTWLYRLHPVISRPQGQHAICKKVGRFTRDEILRDWGSGTYLVQVNGSDGKQLYSETISFHNPDCPPKLDPLEVVVGDPRNQTYFETWGRKPNGSAEPQGKQQPDAGKSETAAILHEVFEKANTVDPALIDLWKEAAQKRDDLAKLLSEKKDSHSQPDVLSVLTQVKALQADPLEMLEKLKSFFPVAKEKTRPTDDSASQGDSLDHLKKVLEVFGQAKEIFKSETPIAAAASPDADLWERIALNLTSQVSSLVNATPAIIMAFKTKPGAPPPPMTPMTSPPAGKPGFAAFDPYRDVSAMKDYVRAQNASAAPAGAAQPSPPEPPRSATGPTAQAADDEMVAQVVSLVNTAISCMNRGIDGHAAAESLITLNGDLAYETLAQQIRAAGIPVVIGLAKGIPEISAQVIAFEEPLKRFLGEFSEGPQWDEGPQDDHDAA